MIKNNLLKLFSIDEDKATSNGKYPGIYVHGEYMHAWDDEKQRYKNDEFKDIRIEVFFQSLAREKILVSLPLTALSKKYLEELNRRADDGETIELHLENLIIGLYQRYKDVSLSAKADGVVVLNTDTNDVVFNTDTNEFV